MSKKTNNDFFFVKCSNIYWKKGIWSDYWYKIVSACPTVWMYFVSMKDRPTLALFQHDVESPHGAWGNEALSVKPIDPFSSLLICDLA